MSARRPGAARVVDSHPKARGPTPALRHPIPREIVLLSKARLALAKARSLDEIKDIRDKAEAMRQYIRQRDDGLEAQNLAAEIRLRAERRAGKMLKVMPKNEGKLLKGAVPRSTDSTADPPTLSGLGISKDQSSTPDSHLHRPGRRRYAATG